MLSLGDAVALCKNYTATHAKDAFRQPKGVLKHPYLVPAGPYNQEWDWDSLFLGVATLEWGSRAYLEGSMLNFLAATNVSNGNVTGCLTPTLPTVCSSSSKEHEVGLRHAKPLIIQGAWLAARAPGGSSRAFAPYRRQMEALLAFWDRPPRRDAQTGLRTWHDQMESGADNCVLSRCPSARSACWTEGQAYTLASADVMVYLQREHVAYARFLDAWAAEDELLDAETRATGGKTHGALEQAPKVEKRAAAAHHRRAADALTRTLNERLWRADLGYHMAINTSTRAAIEAKTYVLALPLWAGLVNASQAAAIARTLASPTMLSAVGLRSSSADDPRYSNADIIVPYSNWRGPMWVNANALACYGLMRYGFRKLALDIAHRVTDTLARDLRASGQWHEAYSTADGAPLAAPGFLSWDTLSAELLPNLMRGLDPLSLEDSLEDSLEGGSVRALHARRDRQPGPNAAPAAPSERHSGAPPIDAWVDYSSQPPSKNCSSPLSCCATPHLLFLCNRSAVCKCEEGGACFTSKCGMDGCCRTW